MTPKDKAKSIIHSASAAAGSVALSPIPFTDAALLVPIQVGMITSLFKAYDQKMMRGPFVVPCGQSPQPRLVVVLSETPLSSSLVWGRSLGQRFWQRRRLA